MGAVRSRPPARPGERRRSGRPSAQTGAPFFMEYRFLANDGSVVWVLDHATLITRNDAGDPGSFQGMMLDITARKEAERKAEAAEDRSGPSPSAARRRLHGRARLRGTDDRRAARRHVHQPQAADLVRYPVEHWVEDPMVWFDMVHPDDRERVAENGQPHLAYGRPVDDPLPDDPLRRRGDLAARHRPHGGAGRGGPSMEVPGDPLRHDPGEEEREAPSRPPSATSARRSTVRSRSRGPRRSTRTPGSSSSPTSVRRRSRSSATRPRS